MNTEGSSRVSQKAVLKVGDAAAILNVSARTVWRMIADDQLATLHIRGCTRVYSWSVEKYLESKNQVVCP